MKYITKAVWVLSMVSLFTDTASEILYPVMPIYLKPMMAIFIYPIWIFFSRTIYRFGKGIRTGARDFILSDEATTETKGKVLDFIVPWIHWVQY